MTWQLAEAKNKLSEVVTRALTVGPQRIRRRDQVVVVLSEAEYHTSALLESGKHSKTIS